MKCNECGEEIIDIENVVEVSHGRIPNGIGKTGGVDLVRINYTGKCKCESGVSFPRRKTIERPYV